MDNPDIPIHATGDKKQDAELAINLSCELQPLGQAIGSLKAAMRRCRNTESPRFKDYEQRLLRCENRFQDIRSFIVLILESHGGLRM